jgi:hypothetical protein
MAQIWRLKPEAYSDISPAAFISAGGYGDCDEVDNSTSPYGAAWVEVTASFTGAVGTATWIHVALHRSPDGTNYEDQDVWAFQEDIVASLRVYNVTDIKWAFYIPNLPPTKFKLKLHNGTATAMDIAPVVLIMRVAKELASA